MKRHTLCCWLCALFTLFFSLRLVHGQEKPGPVTPTETIYLFDGKDLHRNFYSHLEAVKYEDPHRVFTIVDAVDGAPALRISGEGSWGGLITKREYANYHLVAEFRWGDVTWGARKEKSKDSGILLHCFGPDGSRGPWMTGVEFQIIQGGVGDVIVVGRRDAAGNSISPFVTAEVTKDRDGEIVWKKGGEKKTFPSGRINWYGRDPDWKDVLNFRGNSDVESPGKEWTRIEYIAAGDTLKYFVNGVVVNEMTDVKPAAGKLLFQSEGAEIFFRKIELHPIKK